MCILPEYVADVIGKLENNGYEAFAVGGCVRDMLMGRTPNDYDVTTDALPEEIKSCFKGSRVIETGIKHGTVTVISRGENVEITTYRIDGEYADNRHPKSVTFTSELACDLSRRDFTVNAMAVNDREGIVDLFGGRKDIENRTVRCVGDARQRFSEDGLRILRALRFASVLDFTIDRATAEAIYALKDLLKNISVERIYAELSKLICGKNVGYILREYRDVIGVFFPQACLCDDATYRRAVTAAELCKPEKAERYAAYLGVCGGEDGIKGLLLSLNSDNKVRNEAVSIYLNAEGFTRFDTVEARYALSSCGLDISLAAARLRRALAEADGDTDLRERAESLADIMKKEASLPDACLSVSSLKVGGRELQNIGIIGADIGITLNRLLCEVIEGRTANDSDALIKRALAFMSGDVK